MWCSICNIDTDEEICPICGKLINEEVPTEIYWCFNCNIPIIKTIVEKDKNICPLCKEHTSYLTTDLRPVFPEERLLIEILKDEPLKYQNDSVWVSDNRYYINGKTFKLYNTMYNKYDSQYIIDKLNLYTKDNDKNKFNEYIDKFVKANKNRLDYIKSEAFDFINFAAGKYTHENIVISFSGGKDSTVVADLTVRALSDPSIVHIFGDTTLELPFTIDYVNRFRANNPKTIFKTVKNKEQDFFNVCKDIGPPARMMRWCCSMFKTGPITRILNSLFRENNILTFYGIRKYESTSRSKYNRIEDNPESIKINKQKVASPIFHWTDLDVWLYILGEQIDFNDAYKLGYDRVGCWCCPNNNERSQFLSSIYMPEHYKIWHSFLIDFAKQIGKEDPEVYVDTGKWKARQGGNGVKSSKDIKIKFTNCTTEEHSVIYSLNKPIDDTFISMFFPFGKLAQELGRKLINEKIIVDINTNVPIISIQHFDKSEYDYAVKIKTMNVAKHSDLQRMISYQIKKYNACRKCLKCESLCKFGAISIRGDQYTINENKCKRCKMCVTAKYLEGGCLMEKYLRTK